MNFQLWIVIFLILLEVQGHTVPYRKSLKYGIYERRGLSCGSTSSICQDFLKSDNLLHKQGFVDFLLQTIVNHYFKFHVSLVCPHFCLFVSRTSAFHNINIPKLGFSTILCKPQPSYDNQFWNHFALHDPKQLWVMCTT